MMSRADTNSKHELECWIAFVLAAAVVVVVGMQAAPLVNWDGLSALAHAHDVLFRDGSVNIALLGFVEPPVPVICYIPLVAVAHLLGNVEIAAIMFGALFMALAALLTARLLVRMSLPLYARIVLLGLLVLHPLTLSYGALGSPIILLLVAVLGMMKSLMRWSDDGHLRDLIGCSLYAALVVLTRYEMVFVVIAAAGYIAIRSYQGEHPWRRIEGTIITFVLPVAYFSALWVGANSVIMGDAWHFLRHTFGGPEAFSQNIFIAVVALPLVAFPFIYALAYHEVRAPGPAHGPAALSLLVVAGMIPPLLMPGGYASVGDGKIWPALASITIMALAGGVLLAAAFLSHYAPGDTKPLQNLRGTVVVAILSVGILAGVRFGGIIAPPTTHTDAIRGNVAFGQQASAERDLGEAITGYLVSPGREDNRAVVVGWPGFAVAFFARQHVSSLHRPLPAIEVYPESRVYQEALEDFHPGDLLVILEKERTWASALAPVNMVELPWESGSWQVYQIRQYYWLAP